MRRNYDIFEKFPDGSTLWRACVSGRYEAHRKMQAFAEHSENDFYAIDIQAHQRLPSDFPRIAARMAQRNFRNRADASAA
jgi:hypothetical protein